LIYFFVFQGKADNFLAPGQLLPDNFVSACAENKTPVTLRMQEVIFLFTTQGGVHEIKNLIYP
jgi:hypothetical protein